MIVKKISIVKQHDITDCGPACLASIISYYGGYVPIEVLRLKCQTNSDGTSVYNLIEAAKKYNLSSKAFKVKSLEEIYNISKLPCIVHVKLKNNLNHFMVVYEIKKTDVILMDPAHGKIKIKIDEFNSIFTGIAIVLQPHSTLIKYEKPNTISKIVFSFFIKNKHTSIKLLLFSIVLVNLSIIINYFLKCGSLVSFGDSSFTILIYICFIYFYIYLLKNLIDYMKNKLIIYMNKNISSDLYQKFSHQLFILPLNFIKSKTSGEIISRYNELSQINQMIPELIITITLDIIMALVTLVFSGFISMKLTIISISLMLIYVAVCLTQKNPTLQNINKNISMFSDFNTNIIDSVNTIISTKFLNNEENMEQRLEKSGASYLGNSMELETFFNKANFIKNLIFDIGKWFIISYGLYLCFMQKLTIINLFTFEMVINYFFDPVKDICGMLPKICFMKSSFYKLNEFAIIKERQSGRFNFSAGKIEITNLSFSYDTNNNVLNNINLVINENEKILIQGKSGSGKSTLCQILSKQLDYKSGVIKIHDTNIKSIKSSDYRKNITYIGQKDSLLVDTIFKNIIYERNILDKDFKNVCDICEIDEILDKKINRFNTVINESSMNISGGEKQRIILARGLLNPGEIIILDEALSEVNKDMEERIIKKIFSYFKNKTIIYVSHKEYENLFDRKVLLNG